jgi:hypothetical protein
MSGGTWRPTLESAVQMSPDGPPPTITADEYRGKGRKAAMWPTPNVPNGGRTTWHAEQEGNTFYHDGKKVQFVLEQAVRMWPTPTAHTQGDWQTFIQQRLNATTRQDWIEAGNPLPTGQGQLNPNFVEWLMGWPRDWSRHGPLNGQTYRAWQQVFRTALIAYVPSAMGGYHCVQQ